MLSFPKDVFKEFFEILSVEDKIMEKKIKSNMAVLSQFSISEVSSKFDLYFTKGLAEKVKELMFTEEQE